MGQLLPAALLVKLALEAAAFDPPAEEEAPAAGAPAETPVATP
jgi:hypothetical protein